MPRPGVVRQAPAPGEIIDIRVNPINAARQETSGIDATLRYALRRSAWGDFVLRATTPGP